MYHETIVTCRYRIIPTHQTTNNNQHIYDMHVNVYVIIRTYPQFYHDLITMRGLCRHTWERTHAITLNTTPVPPCKIFIIIRHSRIYTFRKFLTVKNVRCTWYRLTNITDYSFHTLWTFLTVKNVTFTWYRFSNVTVYSFHTLSPIFFLKFENLG